MTKTKHGALRNEKESVVGHIYQVSYGQQEHLQRQEKSQPQNQLFGKLYFYFGGFKSLNSNGTRKSHPNISSDMQSQFVIYGTLSSFFSPRLFILLYIPFRRRSSSSIASLLCRHSLPSYVPPPILHLRGHLSSSTVVASFVGHIVEPHMADLRLALLVVPTMEKTLRPLITWKTPGACYRAYWGASLGPSSLRGRWLDFKRPRKNCSLGVRLGYCQSSQIY